MQIALFSILSYFLAYTNKRLSRIALPLPAREIINTAVLKGYIMRTETSLAKERAVVGHLARDLAQAMDESYVDIEHTLAEVEVR